MSRALAEMLAAGGSSTLDRWRPRTSYSPISDTHAALFKACPTVGTA
jgi:hypothetical protein